MVVMDRGGQHPPLDRVLFASPRLRIGKFRVAPGDPRFHDSGPIERHIFVFPRASVYIRHAGGRRFLADPNVVTYYNRGQVYRRDPASAEGDRCDWFAFAPHVLLPALRDVDPGAEERPETPFAFDHGPSDAGSYLLQRRVVRSLERRPETDPLWVEESLLRVLDGVLAPACASRGRRAPTETQRRGRDLAENAKQLLAARLAERVSLDEIAGAVGCSAFHLCRLFRRETGFTLHGYRQSLRLRRALERVGRPESDLSGLALELGFSSHSHFTAAFRRAFGVTPSGFRARG